MVIILCACFTTWSQRLQDFAIQTSFQWIEQGVKDQNYKDFVVKKNVLLKRYGSFKNLIVLHHLELLTSTEKSQKLTMLFHSQTH